MSHMSSAMSGHLVGVDPTPNVDHPMFVTTLGDRVREKRNEMGISQEALARRIGCSSKTIARYESGEQKPRRGARLDALVQELGVSESWLEYGIDPEGETTLDRSTTQIEDGLSNIDKALNLFREKLTPALEAHIRERHQEGIAFFDGGT